MYPRFAHLSSTNATWLPHHRRRQRLLGSLSPPIHRVRPCRLLTSRLCCMLGPSRLSPLVVSGAGLSVLGASVSIWALPTLKRRRSLAAPGHVTGLYKSIAPQYYTQTNDPRSAWSRILVFCRANSIMLPLCSSSSALTPCISPRHQFCRANLRPSCIMRELGVPSGSRIDGGAEHWCWKFFRLGMVQADKGTDCHYCYLMS